MNENKFKYIFIFKKSEAVKQSRPFIEIIDNDEVDETPKDQNKTENINISEDKPEVDEESQLIEMGTVKETKSDKNLISIIESSENSIENKSVNDEIEKHKNQENFFENFNKLSELESLD